MEMVAAAVLLSATVVTLCAISNKSLTGVRLNRQHELAWQLLDRQLTLIDYIGIEQFIELGQFEGDFGDEEDDGMVYYWSSNTTEGPADNLYQVDMAVSWSSQNKSGLVSASTVFNGTGSLELPDETEEPAQSAGQEEQR